MRSVWIKDCDIERREELKGDISADVCVIGGGLCGTLTAFRLKEKGVDAVVLEADRIGMGQTCGTTAKITLQHGYIFKKLRGSLGHERAKMYFSAANKAIDEYIDLVSERRIDCDLEKRDSFIYTLSDRKKLEKEAAVARCLGVNADFAEDSELCLPIKTLGAVRVRDQFQFNPIKFIKHISKDLKIYENSRVIKVEEDTVRTDKGSVKAKAIVFACHYPMMNFPGLYFARLYTERSYVLAIKGAQDVQGMYLDESGRGLSFRNYGDLLLLGGGAHRTGKEGAGYDVLYRSVKELCSQGEVIARWSAQDCIPPDDLQYIGRYAGSRKNWYVATGFKKWGMTSAMTAADVISDAICGIENDHAELFSPSRLNFKTFGRVAEMSAEAVKGLSKQALSLPKETEEDIKEGEGGKIRKEGCKCGVYNDGQRLHEVTTRCSHMGCELNWNNDEHSWDCPCHGSRFAYDGEVISGPAVKQLDRMN